MNYETVSSEEFGASLRGIGVNILVRDVRGTAAFLVDIFGMSSHRLSDDFAIMVYGREVLQLHHDGTYHSNPMLGLVPENPPRGGGIELRLYESDPDEVAARARAKGYEILQNPSDKPHGLREVYVLDPDGYVWVASRPK